MVAIAVAGILGSAAVNLVIVSMAVGRYQKALENCQKAVDTCINEIGNMRTSLTGAREDIARIKGRINGKGWKQEV
jgi:hypothetical protein